MKLTGKIDDKGKLLMANRDMLTHWLAQNANKDVQLEVKVLRGNRSTPQNKYYWGCIVDRFYEIFRNAGLTITCPEEAHEILKARFNIQKGCNEHGEVVEVVKSTASNDTKEQEIYHEKCREWALDFWGVYIEKPNEQIELPIDIIHTKDIA